MHLDRESQLTPAQVFARPGQHAGSPIRVLAVDDSPDFLKLVVRLLSTAPAIQIVGQAHSGYHALEQVTALHPDLVLMDVAMPDMNGLEATRTIKARPGAPRVIILTLHDNAEYRAAAEAAGADAFVAKWELNTALLPLIYILFEKAAPGPQTG
jgi:DNA-binding NarL/FixJ family response regulator